MNNISRKNFIKGAAIAVAGIPFGKSALGSVSKLTSAPFKTEAIVDKVSLSIFSKHLQWLNYKDMASLAAQLGVDGIDLTVRVGGHVLPERVKDDLPKAVEDIKQAGLNVYTITTDIRDADEKYTADVLKTASMLGIKSYRMGWYSYDSKLDTLANIAVIKKRITALAAINEQYKIHGDYENHTGRFAGPLWDLWEVLKDLNSQWMGCQFDIRHATVDGAEAWPVTLDLLKNYIGSVTIKDFRWTKINNKWVIEDVPLGQGMVDFKKYLAQLKKLDLLRPISLHYEYPLGGANDGATKLTLPKEDVIKAIQRDVNTLKELLKDSGLV
ncbi:MAG: sugar phosphate isomerase/epimerase [Mucilaginibacter sp.]|uniref:sugar phosphate isomerase/epimerase family protein n=1 Tax=Mucilaginibacter sp. TaxID=1882438 RepID=UPI00260AAA3B|nr:sugar phosphate isomerase/epimerase family protein [Mucilaginibacter sp.]MDB5003353.1 sugar phosphate isomerase/epimerase [Mucilaginibacter sp.]